MGRSLRSRRRRSGGRIPGSSSPCPERSLDNVDIPPSGAARQHDQLGCRQRRPRQRHVACRATLDRFPGDRSTAANADGDEHHARQRYRRSATRTGTPTNAPEPSAGSHRAGPSCDHLPRGHDEDVQHREDRCAQHAPAHDETHASFASTLADQCDPDALPTPPESRSDRARTTNRALDRAPDRARPPILK